MENYIGSALSLGTGLLGMDAKNKADYEAKKLRRELLNKLEQLNSPTIASQELNLEGLTQQGEFTPEMEQVYQQEDTGLRDITTDPSFKDAQMDVLSELEQLSNNGFSVEDASALRKVQNQVNASDKGRRDAIAQRAAASGRLNSGTELAMQLRNAQDAVTNESNAGLDIAADERKRAMDALIQRGSMAGGMRDQEFSEKSQAEKAQDMINEFNTRNKQQVMGNNVIAKNDAFKTNLGEKQRIADANVATRNEQQAHNKGLIQKDYDNQLNKFDRTANVTKDNAQQIQQAGKETAAVYGGVGSGIGQIMSSIGQKKRNNNYLFDEEK